MSASTLSLHAVSPWSEPRNGRDKPGPIARLTLHGISDDGWRSGSLTSCHPWTSCIIIPCSCPLRMLYVLYALVLNLWDAFATWHLRHRAWPWPPSPTLLDERYAPLSASHGCSYTVTLEMRGVCCSILIMAIPTYLRSWTGRRVTLFEPRPIPTRSRVVTFATCTWVPSVATNYNTVNKVLTLFYC
ncbi:hypothetical protein L227DRAFT_439135 [Lentinus tigrinus ALCF2SS1-6]|uniref:Uncharacterized protein n=1 Tax=Lentinus tigrinus ALCF2SS1-6 TaxID=1328759 RepID=A0A5C2SHX4_9APHY|nr:hypothetical protein L227DRAFT_439135 [Lentinus tigrinus ALCF2SS1-6]